MKATKVVELRTLAQVVRFCRILIALKQAAPRSLRCTVAITLERDVAVREPQGGVGAGQFGDELDAGIG